MSQYIEFGMTAYPFCSKNGIVSINSTMLSKNVLETIDCTIYWNYMSFNESCIEKYTVLQLEL